MSSIVDHKRFIYSFILFSLFCFALPASTLAADSLEEGEDDFAAEIWDPLEPVNRGVFWFNDQLYEYILRPLSKGYDYITPTPVQIGVKNFFRNLDAPIDFASNLLQLEFKEAGKSLARFVINTTVGVGGIFDVGKKCDLPYQSQDFGTALAYWGVPHGFYLVLPGLGSSSLRDGIGTAAERFVYPPDFPNVYFDSFDTLDSYIYSGSFYTAKAIEVVNRRRDAIDGAKESSLDYYLFAQSAYYQYRAKQVRSDAAKEEGTGEGLFKNE